MRLHHEGMISTRVSLVPAVRRRHPGEDADINVDPAGQKEEDGKEAATRARDLIA